jgi:hypothetical protein
MSVAGIREQMIAYHQHNLDVEIWVGKSKCPLEDCPVCVGGEMTSNAAGRALRMMILDGQKEHQQ